MELKGKYNETKIFTDKIDDSSREQIIDLLNNKHYQGSKIRFMPDVHAGAGCTIGTTMTLKDRVNPELVGYDIGCLDRDTEVFTTKGWIKISDYKNGDKILNFDKESEESKFEVPKNYIVMDCEKFYHFKNSKGLDQMLSEEHKMLIWKGYKKRGYKKQDMIVGDIISSNINLNKGYYGIKCCFSLNNESIDMTDNEIRIDIMISADGTIRKNNKIELHLKKERKIKRAKYLLYRSGISYQEYVGKYNDTYIIFDNFKNFNKDLSKYFNASKHQLNIICEESLLWDGHNGYRSFYSSTNKINADVVQFAFSSNGIRAGISVNNPKRENWNNVYIVTPTRNQIVAIGNNIKEVGSIDGKKYCFTMSSGYFVARREGKVFVTGNCGVLTTKFKSESLDFNFVDTLIRSKIPYGFDVNEYGTYPQSQELIDKLICRSSLRDKDRLNRSLVTLGGGNHFIEIGRDENDNEHFYLTIHTGSRNLGLQVCKHYLKLAKKTKTIINPELERKALIWSLKSQGKQNVIQEKLEKLNKKIIETESANILTGNDFLDYLHDIKIVQEWARLNRNGIASTILHFLGVKAVETIESVHNYIDTENMILRKGAISAKDGEKVVIPLNMRDGLLLGVGKGDEDWNQSAPHGAGRLMSRTQAREAVRLEDYKKEMEGIFSTCINENTIDESPFAYKNAEDIIKNIKISVSITQRITPVYSFKAN